MCGTCESEPGGRWTSTRLIVLVLVATLLALSAAGLVSRLRSDATVASAPCKTAVTETLRFQTAVTRDLDSHPSLHADVEQLTRTLRTLGATRCPETARFLAGAARTLEALCVDCAAELARMRRPTPDI